MTYTQQRVRYVRITDDENIVNDVDLDGVSDLNVLGCERQPRPALTPVPDWNGHNKGIIHQIARANAYALGARGNYGIMSNGSHQLPARPKKASSNPDAAFTGEEDVDELERMLQAAKRKLARLENLAAMRAKMHLEVDDLMSKMGTTIGGKK